MARGGGPDRKSTDPNELFSQFHDVFKDFFGDFRGQILRGADRSAAMEISLAEAADGARKPLPVTRRVRCERCKTAPAEACEGCGGTRLREVSESLTIVVPAGVDHGQILRLQGKGDDAPGDGPPGNLLVQIAVTPHPDLRRRDADLLHEVVIEPEQARAGTSIEVPTLAGKRRIALPAGATTGTEVILKGHGTMRLGAEPAPIPEETGDPYRSRDVSAHRGDQIVIVRLVGDEAADPASPATRHEFDGSTGPPIESPQRRRAQTRAQALLLGAAILAAALAALLSSR